MLLKETARFAKFFMFNREETYLSVKIFTYSCLQLTLNYLMV